MMPNFRSIKHSVYISLLLLPAISSFDQNPSWQSNFVKVNKDASISYVPDDKGNTIPDFSAVGYYAAERQLPDVGIVKTIGPAGGNDAQSLIQSAIDEVSKMPVDKNGFRGAILLKKGTYLIPGSIKIEASGIVLRGEGDETKLVAAGAGQRALINVLGKGKITELPDSRTSIMDSYVPAGAKSLRLTTAKAYRKGDRIIVSCAVKEQWIKDLKMDQIDARDGTKQWKASEYNFQFERMITKVEGNSVYIDNPVVMPMQYEYTIGEIYKYRFEGRINNIGIENLSCESEFANDTAENHGWDAIHFDKIENGWIRNITSKYFGYSCVNLDDDSRNITVKDCICLDPKSVITGGRRYSFNNTGQFNLFMNCAATDGRHDYVTGARVRGPNVFYNCTAKKAHADIGPHHRWAMGTLYDNIVTDGEINIQDRGNWGSGHGWSGVTQVLWNCTVKKAAVQNPYVSGKNYCIGLKGEKAEGRLKGRPDAEWEGQNKNGLQPQSLYLAQMKAAKKKVQ